MYGIHDALSDPPSTTQPYGKRKRAAEEEPREAPLRQVRRTTQEDAQTSSEGSKDTLLGSASSAGPSNNSSGTLLPTPPTFGHRPKPLPREHANPVAVPPPVTKPASILPSARPSSLVTAPPKPTVPSAPTAVPPTTTPILPPILPPAPILSALPAPSRTAVPVPDAPFVVPPGWRAPEPVIVVGFSAPCIRCLHLLTCRVSFYHHRRIPALTMNNTSSAFLGALSGSSHATSTGVSTWPP